MEAPPQRAIRLETQNGQVSDIFVEEGMLDRLSEQSFLTSKPSSISIITDSTVNRLYGKRLLARFPKAHVIVIKGGEKSKTLESASLILSKLAAKALDKSGVVISLGGGVICDLSGFVASIYKRGIACFHVPTTLLAQVDASIGGKTGVDTRWGKNQIGTFHEPRGVFIDPLVLSTLPKSELINGAAEMLKYAVISSKKMFEYFEKIDLQSLQSLKPLIGECCRIKADIVSKDEREMGLRRTLNFGHTVGHALEAASNYKLSHGRCVILGMRAEAWISKEMGLLASDDFERLNSLLSPLVEKRYVSSPREILHFAFSDKKNAGGKIMMSLPEKIGEMHSSGGSYTVAVSEDLFKRSLDLS